MIKRDIFDGEFDWFAIDQEGQIAHFSSAGYGVIPTLVRDNVDQQLKLNEYFTKMVEKVTTANLIRGKGKRDDWLNMAQRGLYSYDFKHWDGPYILIAKPDVPINIRILPDEIYTLLREVCFCNVDFRELESIRPEDFFPC